MNGHPLQYPNALVAVGTSRDTLGLLVEMRNGVTHPTRDRPDAFDVYEGAEASMWLVVEGGVFGSESAGVEQAGR